MQEKLRISVMNIIYVEGEMIHLLNDNSPLNPHVWQPEKIIVERRRKDGSESVFWGFKRLMIAQRLPVEKNKKCSIMSGG